MYDQTPNWSWMFYPPPYNFLAPPATFSKPGFVAPEKVMQPRGSGMASGLGCACNGKMGGLGQDATTPAGLFGTGLFVSADPSQWGWGEWAAVVVGGYLTISLVGDITSGASAAYGPIRRSRAKSRKRSRLQSALDDL
jgi:hypothetical protein